MKVLYIGHFTEGTGWSKAARDNVKSLQSVGVDVVCRNISLSQNSDKQIEEINRQVEVLRMSIEEEKVHYMTSREKDDTELIDLMRGEGERIMKALAEKMEENWKHQGNWKIKKIGVTFFTIITII